MDLFGGGAAVLAAGILIFLMICQLVFVFSRYRKAGPNEALIVYGGGRERVVVGGGIIVWPFVNECKRLSLEPKSVLVAVQGIETQSSTKVTVEGLAQVGVDRNDRMILRAAERMLDRPDDEIEEMAADSLEGRLRSEMRTMTLEEARQKQEQLAQRAAEGGTQDLAGMGLCVQSFIIRDIRES